MDLNLQKNVDLSLMTTMRLHSIAEYYFEAKSREDLLDIKKYSIDKKFPLFILGGGSNTLFIKGRLDGIIVRNKYEKKEITAETNNYVDITFSSGYPVAKVVNETITAGYEGLEYHLGLPGTVGGAIYMNSKWIKPEMYFGNDLIDANIVDQNGEVKTVDRDYFQFAYDTSILQKTHEILLEATFRLRKADPDMLKQRARGALDYRKQTQPFGVATSGCIFRNVDGRSAGELIDKSELKEKRIGAFEISPIHANFVINHGGGRSQDLKQLIDETRETVKNKFKVDLQPEVIIV